MSSLTLTGRLTIFEGPDGGGKTTAAQQFAEHTGAVYLHHGPQLEVTAGWLARFYVESMLPALVGGQDVVLDRSWVSETVYARAYRDGRDRVTPAQHRQLQRLALRCGVVFVLCLPPWQTVVDNHLGRTSQGGETYDGETPAKLRLLYDGYQRPEILAAMLPNWLTYDYTRQGRPGLVPLRFMRHPLGLGSAGNWKADIALVGDSFGEYHNQDSYYQWPFGSLGAGGCSAWLADKLNACHVPEHKLFWVNADQALETPVLRRQLAQAKTLVALGQEARQRLQALGLHGTAVVHPQAWKRFHHPKPYPLCGLLRRSLGGRA